MICNGKLSNVITE